MFERLFLPSRALSIVCLILHRLLSCPRVHGLTDLRLLLDAMLAAPTDSGRESDIDAETSRHSVGYVLLPTRKQRDYVTKMRSIAGKRGLKMQPDVMHLPVSKHLDGTTGGGGLCQEDTSVAIECAFSEAVTPVFQCGKNAHARLVRCWRLLDSTHIASVVWCDERMCLMCKETLVDRWIDG